MPRLSRLLASAVLCSIGCLLPACGGEFEGGDPEPNGGQAGSTAKGGSGGGGTAGSAGAGRGGSTGGGASCEHDGITYEDGASVPSGDCNSCSCINGQVGCTALGCPEEGCYQGDTFYLVGDEVYDGCNTCYCDAPGQWSCTLVDCPTCSDLETIFADEMLAAKSCDPAQSNPCSASVIDGLACRCPSFANPEYDIGLAEYAQAKYDEMVCAEGIACGACPPLLGAYCSSDGACVDVYESGLGTACKVDGSVYPSGTSGIPDPASCNFCTCSNGVLECDLLTDCPIECPPDTVLATQCATCSLNDGCAVLEHLCLPVCTETCETGACIEGVCRTVCG